MNSKKACTLAAALWIGLVAAGCISAGKEVESLDLAQCASDEGIVVVRFITARADEDDLEHPELDPDIDYEVSVGTSKSMLLKGFAYEGGMSVEGEDGPALIVRKMDAGDYYFNEIDVFSGSAPLAVKFTVLPGRVTYIGDLHVTFIEDNGFFGMSQESCALVIASDEPAVLGSLKGRFSVVPAVDTRLMVIEELSL